MCRPEMDSNLNITWVFLHSCKFSATTFWLNSLWKSIPKSGFSSLLCKWCQLHLSAVQIQVHMVKQFDPLEIKSELISRREWASPIYILTLFLFPFEVNCQKMYLVYQLCAFLVLYHPILHLVQEKLNTDLFILGTSAKILFKKAVPRKVIKRFGGNP